MKTSIIIPARYASSRFPGKPLVQLKLPNGTQKSLIELSWQAAARRRRPCGRRRQQHLGPL